MRYTRAGLGRRRGVWAASIGLAVVALLAACAGSGGTSQPPLARATDTATMASTSAATATNTAQPTKYAAPDADQYPTAACDTHGDAQAAAHADPNPWYGGGEDNN